MPQGGCLAVGISELSRVVEWGGHAVAITFTLIDGARLSRPGIGVGYRAHHGVAGRAVSTWVGTARDRPGDVVGHEHFDEKHGVAWHEAGGIQPLPDELADFDAAPLRAVHAAHDHGAFSRAAPVQVQPDAEGHPADAVAGIVFGMVGGIGELCAGLLHGRCDADVVVPAAACGRCLPGRRLAPRCALLREAGDQ
jgi:hypothetical protein